MIPQFLFLLEEVTRYDLQIDERIDLFIEEVENTRDNRLLCRSCAEEEVSRIRSLSPFHLETHSYKTSQMVGLKIWDQVFKEQKRLFSKLGVEQLELWNVYDPDSNNFITPNDMMELLTKHIEKLDQQAKLVGEKFYHLRIGMETLNKDECYGLHVVLEFIRCAVSQ